MEEQWSSIVKKKYSQIINGHVLEVNLLCMINVGSISENEDQHARLGVLGSLTVPEQHLSHCGS
jgi:hypothetical protein